MAKVTLQAGVWSGSAAFVLTGVGGIVAATPWTWPWWLGWASFAVGVGLLFWGISFHGKPWWKAAFRRGPPPPIYLALPPHDNASLGTMYLMRWEPELLNVEFSADGPYDQWPPPPPKETHLRFTLFNAGPDDARQVEITWSLDVDLMMLIHETKVFGNCLHSVEAGRLRLVRPDRAATIPIPTAIQTLPIPIVKAGETIPIAAPDAFTNAFTVCALARAKHHHETSVLPNLLDTVNHLKYLENSSIPLDRPTIRIQYVAGDRRYRHRFSLVCGVSGGNAPVSRKPRDDGSYASVENGVQAVIYNATVIPID
jgi:hypothetical protein